MSAHPSHHAPLRLRLLGGMRLHRPGPGGAEVVLGPGKAFALVAYLSCAPHQTIRREEAVELLWADRDVTHGRNSLRQTIWTLRQRFGDTVITGDDDTVTLSPEIVSDRDEMLQAIERADPAAVVARYAGPFLPAFAVPGGLAFEQWADGERARLRTAFLRAGETVVRAQLGRGEPTAATSLARRISAEDPLRESGWRLLLEALSASGDWLGLAVELDALDAMLAGEHREPEPATAEWIRRLRSTASMAESPPPATLRPDLVGREREFATLISAWTAALGGRATHVHLTGAAGLGKSRLLADLRQRLRGLGAVVLSQRARPGERELPWTLAGDLAGTLGAVPGSGAVPPAVLGDLVDLAPGLSSRFGAAPPPGPLRELPRRRAMAVTELINAVTEEAPLALLIDDLHWADDASYDALQVLVNRLERQPLLLVTASRPDYRPDLRGLATQQITIDPLPPEATFDLVTSLARLPGTAWAARLPGSVHQASEGSPLAAIESLAYAISTGALAIREGEWDAPLPDVLEAQLRRGGSVGAIIQALEPFRRELLVALAVAGTPLPGTSLSVIGGQSDAVTAQSLVALERDGLARSGPGGWEVAHDRTRDLLLETLGEERPAAHRRIGLALLDHADGSVAALRKAALHLRLGRDIAGVRRAAIGYLRLRRATGDPRAASAIVADLLGTGLEDVLVRSVLRELPLSLRIPHFPRRAAMVASGLVPLLLAGALLLQRPHLDLVATPLGAGPLTPPPTVELRGITGRAVSRPGDTVRVEVASGPGALVGNVAVAVVDGRARFDDLDLQVPGNYVLRFTSPGFTPVVSDTIRAGLTSANPPRLRVLRGTLNNRPIRPDNPETTIRPGEAIVGTVEMSYSTYWSAAAVFMCGGTSWGQPAASWWTVYPLATPAEGAKRTATLNIKGPVSPGMHHIILALYADRSCDYVMSGTNWTIGEPVWGDGNDLSGWGARDLDAARQTGSMTIQQLRNHVEFGPRAMVPTVVGAAVITVRVE